MYTFVSIGLREESSWRSQDRSIVENSVKCFCGLSRNPSSKLTELCLRGDFNTRIQIRKPFLIFSLTSGTLVCTFKLFIIEG